jgi:hypothetical protein
MNIEDRLLSHRKVAGDCWLWTGARNNDGYGNIGVDGKIELVHRVSYALYHKIVFSDLKSNILHVQQCLNRNCFNPVHLYEGDQQQNAYDRTESGNGQNMINNDVCRNGHLRTKENTYRKLSTQGFMVNECRICRQEADHRRYVKKRILNAQEGIA